ncbi:glycosyltransferase family 1 protein, partial [Streptomyces mirabilis]
PLFRWVPVALARGCAVGAAAGGVLPGGVGRAPDGGVPGILVPPENPAALAAELRGWFGEADVRRRLKAAARSRRAALDGWATTARSLAGVLGRLPQQPRRAA